MWLPLHTSFTQGIPNFLRQRGGAACHVHARPLFALHVCEQMPVITDANGVVHWVEDADLGAFFSTPFSPPIRAAAVKYGSITPAADNAAAPTAEDTNTVTLGAAPFGTSSLPLSTAVCSVGRDPDAASTLTADLAEAPSHSSMEVLSHLQQGAVPDESPPDESMPHTAPTQSRAPVLAQREIRRNSGGQPPGPPRL